MELLNRETQKVMDDLDTAVAEGEASLENLSGDNASEVRARLQAALDKAKAAYARMQEKTRAAAKATDKTVREHPYQAMGIAFGIGILIGVLAMRSRADRD